jgi:hypothetical protein
VVARIPATGTPRSRIVVCGHYDTQRTGRIWTALKWMTPLVLKLPMALQAPLLLLQLTMAGQVVLGALHWAWGESAFLAALRWVILASYAIFGGLFAEWAAGRYVPGVSDNASGAAAVVSLTEAWSRNPSESVEWIALLTGCEESGLLGASAWLNRHAEEIRSLPTRFLNLDGLGFGPPRYFGWEIPVVGPPVPYPKDLLETAGQVAQEQGLENAGPRSLPGPMDGLAFLERGVPGIALAGFREGGELPHYHEMSDTSANMDFDAAWAGTTFAWGILRRWRREFDGDSADDAANGLLS